MLQFYRNVWDTAPPRMRVLLLDVATASFISGVLSVVVMVSLIR